MPPAATSGPTVLDALSLLSEVADDLVVKTARDTHLAFLDRVGSVTRGRNPLHRGIAGAVYGGLTLGLRAASSGLDKVASTGVGPRLEEGPRGRFVSAAVNGLIGDRLVRERPQLAIPMAVRLRGADVDLEPDALAVAYPAATGRLVLFLHGLCENESYFQRHRERTGTTYPDMLAGLGWTPLMLRANTGLSLRENGAALAALVQRVVDHWPVPVTRVAMVGHSLGGLVIRAAGAVADGGVERVEHPWRDRVSDVITLGTPHLGAPIARGVGHGSRGLGRVPETAAFGRILDWRSQGVHDLVAGLAEDVPPLPQARYRLVAATLTASHRHPVGHVIGDLLVRPHSAHGRDRHGRELFPGADVLHVGRTDHFGLLNHPVVHRAMRHWLA
ncbi:esterase/lipase family protein [Nocardioides dilutus]